MIGLGTALYMIVKNLPLVVGGQTAANTIVIALVGSFVAGAGAVAFAKARRPELYDDILPEQDVRTAAQTSG